MNHLIHLLLSALIALLSSSTNSFSKHIPTTAQAPDTSRVLVLVDSSRAVLYQKPDASLELAVEAFMLSKNLKYQRGEALSLLAMGRVNTVKGNIAESITNVEASIEIFRKINDKRRLASALSSLGNAYKTQSNYNTAITYYLESLALCEELKILNGVSANLNNIGLIYNEMQNYEQAEEYYLRSLKISQELENDYLLATSYNNLGLLYTSTGQLDVALSYHKKSLELKEKASDKIGSAYSLNNIGKVYLERGKTDSAEIYITRSMIINPELDPDLLAISNELMAKVYLLKNDHATALEYAKKSFELAEQVGVLLGIQEAHNVLALVYEQAGDYENAYKHKNEYVNIRLELADKDRYKEISELESKFHLDKKKQEIEILKLENANREIVQMALVIGIVLLILIGFLIFRAQQFKIRKSLVELENNRLKQKQLQTDLESKNKRLTSQSLNLLQKNEVMIQLREKVAELKRENPNRELNSLSHIVEYSINQDKDWEQFQMVFEEVHSGFYQVLKEQCPDMTPNDLKLCALIKLNLTIKDMASILAISPDSVKTARYRLRKKLGLETEQNLTEYLLELERDALALT